jgi:hypothetical protein
VWWDLHLSAGDTFDEEIDRRLHQVDAVVVLWSRHSVASRWVKAEADVAAEREVLVPARLDDVEIPLPFRRTHAADLAGWRGRPESTGLTQIRSALVRLSPADQPVSAQIGPTRPSKLSAQAAIGEFWRDWRVWIGLVILVVSVAVSAFLLGGHEPSSETVELPDIIGMRLDEARLELNRLGIFGPGERNVQGEPFPEGTGDLETITRVKDLSPPPGSVVSLDEPEVTLYLEFCDGSCLPKATVQKPASAN